MKKLFITCFAALLMFSCSNKKESTSITKTDSIPPLDRSMVQKPPMGWNSWNCLGWDANESQVRAAADFMAKNLKDLGYEYIIIDQMWYGDETASDFEAFVQETIPLKPNYSMDEFGRLLPDPVKFPSSVNGKGFKPLADYIHGLGLKFGVHLLRGIPWKAADNHVKIKGTDIDAATISQPDKGCDWYDGFYGVDMTIPGAQQYYNSVFQLFAAWGIDFVKADDMNDADIVGMSKALRSSGRPMVFSVVPNEQNIKLLKENVHMARTGADFWDVWQMLKVGFPVAAKAVKNQEPGFWPDLDMLPIGKIGIKLSYKGPNPRISNFTKDELHTLLTLWYISRQPLFIGSYLPETDATTMELLKNKEALEVDRNSINNRQVKFKNAVIIWAADIPDTQDKYLAFFNQWESKQPVNIKVKFEQLGLSATDEYKVRDLWAMKDLGKFKGEFSYPIIAHGAGLYKISK